MHFELTKELLDEIKEAIDNRKNDFLKNTFGEMYAEDITTILNELSTEEAIYIFELLDQEKCARVLTHMNNEVRKEFLKNFNSAAIAHFFSELYSDDAADILNELPVKTREEVIALLDDKEFAAHINELLRYDEDCAGGLMVKEMIKANVNWTAGECIDEIRRQAEDVERIYSIYVVDNANHLLGRVSLKKIIISDPAEKISNIYQSEILSVETYKDASDVVSLMQKYDLEAIPVVNIEDKLVGRITIDDALDYYKEQTEADMQAMTGISGDIAGREDQLWRLSSARLPWLIIGVVGGMMGANIIGIFEENLVMIPAMAFFIPLITATAGNVGVQSSSIVVQSLASNVISESLPKRLFKTIMVGIINGIIICIIVFLLIFFMRESLQLSLIVSASLFFVVLLASIMGTFTPLILEKLNVNPALASGPFITTANDLIGLGVYFAIATLLLNA